MRLLSVKTCTKCKTLKSIDDFRERTSRGRKIRLGSCRACDRASNLAWRNANREKAMETERAWRKKNPDARRQRGLKEHYDMTIDGYNALLLRQSGVCAICEKRCATGCSLAVDHDHTTGIVRGLLCRRCNQALGSFHDSVDVLKAALRYLRYWKGQEVEPRKDKTA